MQYKVPQFIEIEDKIFGPLTFKQFLYLAAGGGGTLICITLLPLWIGIVASTPFLAAGGALAFYKVNDQPLIVALEHAFEYIVSAKLYLWKHRDENQRVQKKKEALPPPAMPKFTESRLKDLAWSLNIKDRIGEGEAAD